MVRIDCESIAYNSHPSIARRVRVLLVPRRLVGSLCPSTPRRYFNRIPPRRIPLQALVSCTCCTKSIVEHREKQRLGPTTGWMASMLGTTVAGDPRGFRFVVRELPYTSHQCKSNGEIVQPSATKWQKIIQVFALAPNYAAVFNCSASLVATG